MKGTLQIRKYQDIDLDQCRNLWKELVERHREIYFDSSIGGDKPEFFFDEHLNNIGADQIWVAVVDTSVVGFVGLDLEKEEAEIEPIVVRKDWRNRGVGELLVEKAICEAQKKGVKFLNVMPVARNAKAMQFFRKMGFRNLGRVQLFMDFSGKQWKSSLKLHECEFDY